MAAEKTYQYNLQDIERYLNGKMTAQDMHALEKAALTDPLLADAIDGFRGANPLTSARHLNEIAALLQKEQGAKAAVVPIGSTRSNWKGWVVAAGAAGLMGLGAWLLLNRDNSAGEIAELTTPKTSDSVVAAPATENIPSALQKDSIADFAVAEVPKTNPEITIEKTGVPAINSASPATKTTEEQISSDGKGFVGSKEIPARQEINVTENPVADQQNRVLNQPVFSKAARNQVRTSVASVRDDGLAKASFSGKVMDEKGSPLAGASVSLGNAATVTNNQGKFTLTLPMVNDSVDNVSIAAVGYKTESATLFAGRTAGIAMEPDQNNLSEVVIVGFGSKKKARMGSIRDLKTEPMQDISTPFPEGGWDAFYDDILEDLGMNKEKANKLLHLRFFIEDDGKPTNFTVVKTPDMAIADRAIAAIKAGPRWQNYRKRKTAEIKMNVE